MREQYRDTIVFWALGVISEYLLREAQKGKEQVSAWIRCSIFLSFYSIKSQNGCLSTNLKPDHNGIFPNTDLWLNAVQTSRSAHSQKGDAMYPPRWHTDVPGIIAAAVVWGTYPEHSLAVTWGYHFLNRQQNENRKWEEGTFTRILENGSIQLCFTFSSLKTG